MQKHTSPDLHQTQTREALRLVRHYFGRTSAVSFDEKRQQAEREVKRNLGVRVARFLTDMGFKVR